MASLSLGGAVMEVTNRSAIVVKPAQPFLEWLHQIDPENEGLTLADLTQEPTIYLLPPCETDEEFADCIREFSGEIFEEELNSWYTDPELWPAGRGPQMFSRWFECSLHSMIIDLSDEPIVYEDT